MIDLKKVLEKAFKTADKQKQPDIVMPSRCPLEGRCARCENSCPMFEQTNSKTTRDRKERR